MGINWKVVAFVMLGVWLAAWGMIQIMHLSFDGMNEILGAWAIFDGLLFMFVVSRG